MGEQVERKVVELIERLRRRARPKISQEMIAEHLWPRKYDEEGREVGQPQKSYSLLIAPRKDKDPRRLKFGEFIDACQYLNFDPIQLLTLAKLAAERGLEVEAILGEEPDTNRSASSTRAETNKTSTRAKNNERKRLGHGSL